MTMQILLLEDSSELANYQYQMLLTDVFVAPGRMVVLDGDKGILILSNKF